MSEPLRQPLTFWQWVTGQPGTIYTPPPAPLPPRERTALDALEEELMRMHRLIDNMKEEGAHYLNGAFGLQMASTLAKLHDELAKRSQKENQSAAS